MGASYSSQTDSTVEPVITVYPKVAQQLTEIELLGLNLGSSAGASVRFKQGSVVKFGANTRVYENKVFTTTPDDISGTVYVTYLNAGHESQTFKMVLTAQ